MRKRGREREIEGEREREREKERERPPMTGLGGNFARTMKYLYKPCWIEENAARDDGGFFFFFLPQKTNPNPLVRQR